MIRRFSFLALLLSFTLAISVGCDGDKRPKADPNAPAPKAPPDTNKGVTAPKMDQ